MEKDSKLYDIEIESLHLLQAWIGNTRMKCLCSGLHVLIYGSV